jgi:hypothetical protein
MTTTNSLPAQPVNPYAVTNRNTLASAYWIIPGDDGQPKPMSAGEINRQTLALINLHGLSDYHRGTLSLKLRQAREATELTLKFHRRTAAIIKHTDLSEKEAAERFEAQVRTFLTDASFADWDGALAWCQIQTVYGHCLNAYSNLNTTADQLGKLAAEGKALAREPRFEGSPHDDELDRLRERYRKLDKQHAFWEWRLEAATEAYRRMVATVQVTDSGDVGMFSSLSSEWKPPIGKQKASWRRLAKEARTKAA